MANTRVYCLVCNLWHPDRPALKRCFEENARRWEVAAQKNDRRVKPITSDTTLEDVPQGLAAQVGEQ